MKIFFIISLLFTSALVLSEQTVSTFSHLYKHPSSHYFYSCGAGGRSSCGSYMGDQYKTLIKNIKKVTGYKKINIKIFESLKVLDKKRSELINSK